MLSAILSRALARSISLQSPPAQRFDRVFSGRFGFQPPGYLSALLWGRGLPLARLFQTPKKETALTFFIAALCSTPLEPVALPSVAAARPVLNWHAGLLGSRDRRVQQLPVQEKVVILQQHDHHDGIFRALRFVN